MTNDRPGSLYAYRVRVDLPPDIRLLGDVPGDVYRGSSGWELRPARDGISLVAAYDLQVRHGGYGSVAEAEAGATRMADHLRLAGVATSTAFDTGWSPTMRMASPARVAAASVEARAAVRLRPDIPGIDVYEEHRDVTWSSLIDGGGSAHHSFAHLGAVLGAVEQAAPVLTGAQRTACELLFASLAADRGRARLVLAATAYECLLEPSPWSEAASRLIEELGAAVTASGLPADERDILADQIRKVQRESITRRGVALAERLLPGKTYDGHASGEFFKRMYNVRSRLVHRGELPGSYQLVPGASDHSLEMHCAYALISATQTFVRDAILSATGVVAALPPGPLVLSFGPARL